MTRENATIALATISTTVAETNLPKPHTSPQTHLYLGLQMTGCLDTLDEYYTVQGLGKELGYWTHTSETLTLTKKGIETAAKLEAQLS